MKKGYEGTFVISWAQTKVDMADNAPLRALVAGSDWQWSGKALRVDRSRELELLQNVGEQSDIRKRAAVFVHQLVGAATIGADGLDMLAEDDPRLNVGFEVTDGYESYLVSLVVSPNGGCPLLVFAGAVPPSETTLRVVRANMVATFNDVLTEQPSGMAVLTQGTRVRTPSGECPVEKLREGSIVLTREHGGQPVLWVGRRQVSAARMLVNPETKPVRLRAGAIRSGQPDADLLVSPHQQILVSGMRAQKLIGQDEVLASAADLVDGSLISTDRIAEETSYYQVLLGRHEVIWANGVPLESQHPAFSDLGSTQSDHQSRLTSLFPGLGGFTAQSDDNVHEIHGAKGQIGVA
ncbi:Hint domain-containing protein [Aliiroseovarius sp. F20344]|uniref:Hint domain-containing protein n=1 Tax=Aliiroseovarius sp. F20344 TaxID=2926414 RepID=UPI001FF10457|nr:Hint domain-containing protein [Aliiroseovarius sp. F20344]MCK0141760.1 Hint domain-containing protein [Aliiroseovarius sp. F20344]